MQSGTKIKMAEFSLEVMQAKRQWSNIFKVLKEKYYQPRILYSVKISFKNKGKKILCYFQICKTKRIHKKMYPHNKIER